MRQISRARAIVQASAIGKRVDACMTRSMAVAVACIVLAVPAGAQVAPDSVVRLSPAERDAVLQAAERRDERDLPINGLSRGIHGEVGAVVSSNGGHAVYGNTVVPLGESGSAAFSFAQGTSGHWQPR